MHTCVVGTKRALAGGSLVARPKPHLPRPSCSVQASHPGACSAIARDLDPLRAAGPRRCDARVGSMAPQHPFAAPRSPSAPWPAAPAAPAHKSNAQLLDEIAVLPAERDKGAWKRLCSDDGTSSVFVVLRHEGELGDAVSVWLANTQEEAEHIAQHSGRGFRHKSVERTLDAAKRVALECAERSLAASARKRKRDDDAAAAAAALAAPAPGAGAGAGAGVAPPDDSAALQAQLSATLAQLREADARVADLERCSAELEVSLADERRDCETMRAMLTDEQHDSAALRAQLARHQAALNAVRAACDGVAGNAAAGEDVE